MKKDEIIIELIAIIDLLRSARVGSGPGAERAAKRTDAAARLKKLPKNWHERVDAGWLEELTRLS